MAAAGTHRHRTNGGGSAAPLVVIDNYDSFVYILVQYLGELGATPLVFRHDAVTVSDIRSLGASGILISPGPGRPEEAGVSNHILAELSGTIPIFGVCLGMQCMAETFGGRVVRAPQVMHGKTSMIRHQGQGVFQGLPSPFEATRYHSLIVEPSSVPDCLTVTATAKGPNPDVSAGSPDDDGHPVGEGDVVMGLKHNEFDVEGVQFHPESVLTSAGRDLLANFLARCH